MTQHLHKPLAPETPKMAIPSWLAGTGLTALLLGTAALLAFSAVPETRSPHATPPAVSTPTVPSEDKSARTVLRAEDKPAQTVPTTKTLPASVAAVTPARTVEPVVAYGPPERKKSVAEIAIQPLLKAGNDTTDIASVKTALANISARRTSRALAQANTLRHPGARKLVQWFAFRRINSGTDAQVIERFRTENPSWPENGLLRQRAEEALLLDNAPARTIRTFFKDNPPTAAAGYAALAAADIADGKIDEGRAGVRKAWRMGGFGATIERQLLTRFKAYLSQTDIRWRLDQHLLDDNRYGRTTRSAVIRRLITALSPEEATKAKARLTVWRSYRSRSRRRLNTAKRAIAQIERRKSAAQIALPVRNPKLVKTSAQSSPDKVKDKKSNKNQSVEKQIGEIEPTASETTNAQAVAVDWPYEYHRIQLLRRDGKDKAAWKRLLEVPTDIEKIIAPDHWWEERRVNIFNALYTRSYETAYRLAVFDAELSSKARNQVNFMAGWIAFRFLGKHEAALKHFEAFTQSADGPRTRAQSHYWLARLHDVLENPETASKNYKISAREFNTFYGQLARQKLEPEQRALRFPQLPTLTPQRIREAQDSDVLQAIRFARLAGSNAVVRRLLRAIGKSKQDAHIYQLAAEFAKVTGDTQMAVRIGKGALFHGVPLVEHAYPTHAFPVFKPLVSPPEPAMLFGLARQESEFNTLVKSIVGARGVLQVMPATAHGVCREHGLRCGSRRSLTRRLSRDPAYNATLAAAYVSGRLQEFGGSYILAYAGYNAGPGRARYWIRKSGDPRDPAVDAIDWIEMIHLEETREYVKKVMSNLQVYRARLGKPDTALQITSDIERGSL